MGLKSGVWKVEEVINKICELEMYTNPAVSQKVVRRLREAAQTSTHMYVPDIMKGFSFKHFFSSVPHYHVVSKPITEGRLSAVRSYIRSTLLEGVYRPIGTSNGCVLNSTLTCCQHQCSRRRGIGWELPTSEFHS